MAVPHTRRVLLPLILASIVVLVLGLLTASGASAAANCSAGSTMSIVAHEDDTILFQNPDLLHAIQAGQCVRIVFVTAGDDGLGEDYWMSREQGAEAAFAEMAGEPDTWNQSDAGISGHPMPLMTLAGNPNVSLVFMRLPDGNIDGSGFAPNESESLQKLYQDQIPLIAADDGSSSYTLSGLEATLQSLIKSFAPNRIFTQDYVGTYGDGDHSDHHTVAYLTREASEAYKTATHTLIGYMDYPTSTMPSNVTGSDYTQKLNAWLTYAPYDSQVCQTAAECNQTSYGLWIAAQYTVGSETDGPGTNYPPVANAGPNQMVPISSTVRLDGSQSFDSGTSPTYQWTQTSGPTVTLSSATAAQPTFTAPSSPTTLTFQLVVSDGSLTSQTSRVTITVNPPDLALLATATASSQDTADGSTAAKAIDGNLGGYPGDPTVEWATNGGKKGSWLKLTWTSPVTTNEAVLYDRPNLNDQITGATLTFSNGTTATVPALNNNGSATTVMFPVVTTTSLLMTVNSVSSSTQNVGLSEIMVYPAPVSGPPTVSSTSPGALAQGTTSQNVTINGTNFDTGPALAASFGTGVTVNSVRFVSPTQLTANVSVAASATPGARDVKITNGDGSSATGSSAFTVDADPTVIGTAPSALGQGAPNQNVTITGTGFAPGAAVSFGSGVTVNSTTYVSATQLTANISVAATATTGVQNVTVVNLDGGVGTGAGVFTVNGGPVLNSTSPSAADQGATNVSVTIGGANFVLGAPLAASFGARRHPWLPDVREPHAIGRDDLDRFGSRPRRADRHCHQRRRRHRHRRRWVHGQSGPGGDRDESGRTRPWRRQPERDDHRNRVRERHPARRVVRGGRDGQLGHLREHHPADGEPVGGSHRCARPTQRDADQRRRQQRHRQRRVQR